MKIVLALDPSAQITVVIDQVRCVAQDQMSELLGLFVEDSALLEHARSRLAREVLFSGLDRPLDSTVLGRQIRAQSLQARRDFEAAAARLGLRHTFQTARGNVFAELATRARDAETLVVSLASDTRRIRAALRSVFDELARAPIRSLLFAREGWRTGSSILVVIEDVQSAPLLVGVAARLAATSRSPVSIVLAGSAADSPEQVRSVLESGLENGTPKPAIAALVPGVRAVSIAAVAARFEPRIVVTRWQKTAADAELVEALLQSTRSSILLVR